MVAVAVACATGSPPKGTSDTIFASLSLPRPSPIGDLVPVQGDKLSLRWEGVVAVESGGVEMTGVEDDSTEEGVWERADTGVVPGELEMVGLLRGAEE